MTEQFICRFTMGKIETTGIAGTVTLTQQNFIFGMHCVKNTTHSPLLILDNVS